MEQRHFDFNLDTLHQEQRNIDQIIDSLLSYSPAKVNNSTSDQNNTRPSIGRGSSTSSPVQSKRGRGRPTKQNNPPRSPVPTVSSPQSSEISQRPSLGTVIECIKKLSEQNKKLLDYVEVLSSEVNKIKGDQNSTAPSSNIVPDSSSVTAVEDRLDKIEQNLNADMLICSGPNVESLITESANGTVPPNLERLKGKICEAICGEEVVSVDIGSVKLSLFGKEKKKLKIDCRSSSSN